MTVQPLHDYVARQLAERLKSRAVVVWYDPRREFAPFIAEVRDVGQSGAEPPTVTFAGNNALLAEFAGSMFELRSEVEPHVCGDTPERVVVYLPGCERDRDGSVLMELEQAGECWEPQLKRLARNVLRQRYTDGVIDEMLAPEHVTYEDLARASAASTGETPSILKSIFHDSSGSDALLATWLASDTRDAAIEAKEAGRELIKLVRSRLGLALPEDAPVAKLRAITLRYALAGEFRSDLRCPPPALLDGVPAPTTKDEVTALRELAQRLRSGFAEAYATLADSIETELGLRQAKLTPGALGAIDTFRFEERALLAHCGDLIASRQFDAALAIVGEREHSFWLDRDIARKAQWEAVRRMAELGTTAVQVLAEVKAFAGRPAADWISAYTRLTPDSGHLTPGWHRLDQAQRRLETWLVSLDEEPDEQPLGIVRRAYDDVCQAMADGFTKALQKAAWATPGTLHQTRVWSEVLWPRPKPAAYFLVDAMRYEMGVELAERLPKAWEVRVQPATAALPSITPIGMAALQPGAAGSFSVVEQNGKLGARIDDTFLPNLEARRKAAAARVPQLVDLALDELLGLSAPKLLAKVEGAPVVVVRSQEIDHAGETGFTYQARKAMDTVIDNLVRAMGKLGRAGIEQAVVTADHGHLFFAHDRDESMRTDAPGGNTVDLHRRCWIGRGGATPAGCVRVTAAALGYHSDLDFVFPSGAGVLKAGGDLAYHHGGTSLQEMVIPVLTVRIRVHGKAAAGGAKLAVTDAPDKVTNRIFAIKLELGGQQLMLGAANLTVRPILVAADREVGRVGMAIDADLDSKTGSVALVANQLATVVFQLSDDGVKTLRVVVLDPATDLELYRSPHDIPVEVLT